MHATDAVVNTALVLNVRGSLTGIIDSDTGWVLAAVYFQHPHTFGTQPAGIEHQKSRYYNCGVSVAFLIEI